MRRILLLFFILAHTTLFAQIRLPALFNDHMVIQQNTSLIIWGWADASQDVTIKASWDSAAIKVRSDNGAFWKAALNTPPAGGPHNITITAGDDIRILKDILAGEVWLCSGQSNMQWSMESSADGNPLINQINEPNIRLFHIPRSSAPTLQFRGEGEWKVCNKETVKGFSAVAYFFGKKLHENLNIPIGLIHASWGGSPAETWLHSEIVKEDALLRIAAAKLNNEQPWSPVTPGVIFNAMINPIIPYRIAGALWYQGEANVSSPSTYKTIMEKLIYDWRKEFQDDFPFYFVQIAPFSGYDGDAGTLLREQQVKMLEIPRTAMVVISDLVENVNDLHPVNKKPVGERLANVALADNYGKQGIAYQSPLYKSMKVEGNKVSITFEHLSGGLMTKGGELRDFLIAGGDRKFYRAKAKIEKNTVNVSAKEVKKPVAVRFGWSNGFTPNLFSKGGLPVSSFRTDNWNDNQQ